MRDRDGGKETERKRDFLNTLMHKSIYFDNHFCKQTTLHKLVVYSCNISTLSWLQMSWGRTGEALTPFREIKDLHLQTACFSEPLKDGETYQVWIRATDIVGHSKVGFAICNILSGDRRIVQHNSLHVF